MKVKVVPAIGQTTPIDVEMLETETAGVLKKRVCEIKKIPEKVARLAFGGRAVRDEQTMKELLVKDGDKFTLITQAVGGIT
jgi:hypothetical protein